MILYFEFDFSPLFWMLLASQWMLLSMMKKEELLS